MTQVSVSRNNTKLKLTVSIPKSHSSLALFMALAGPSKMRDFLLSKHGLDPKEEDVRGVVLALRKRQRQVLGRWEEALASRDYLCGSRPGLLDAR